MLESKQEQILVALRARARKEPEHCNVLVKNHERKCAGLTLVVVWGMATEAKVEFGRH